MKLRGITSAIMLLLILLTFLKISNNVLSIEEEPSFPHDFPYLFVYPQSIVAVPGQNVTVSICIFNLTENVFRTNDFWQSPKDPYPTYNPNGIHVYPLGSLLGFDVNLTWNPDILEYLNHTVTVPYEDYPDPIPPINYSGTLHTPVVNTTEEVNQDRGYARIGRAHQGTDVFNGDGTLMQITFKIKREGSSRLEISSPKLSTHKLLVPGANKDLIIFRVGHGFVTTPGARTRIYSMELKAAVGTKRFPTPILENENASVKITIKNEGDVTDLYNLTVYHKLPNNTLYKIYDKVNVTIDAGSQNITEIIVHYENLNRGNHIFLANLTVSHEGAIFSESINKTVRVISADLDIEYSWQPQVIYVGDNVTFTATGNHSEPDLSLNFTWNIYEKQNVPPLATLYGTSVSYKFKTSKNWTIVLVARDSLGITWNPDRPATSGYKSEFVVEVLAKTEAVFPWDLVALAIIIVVVIAVIVYLGIRRRR